jgi:hypothetical protein
VGGKAFLYDRLAFRVFKGDQGQRGRNEQAGQYLVMPKYPAVGSRSSGVEKCSKEKVIQQLAISVL